MPIYEYSCQKCGAHIEVTQKITDKPLARHPKCGGKLEKEWSRTGFQFKGSGWYVTDYAKKGSGSVGSSSPSSSPSSNSSEGDSGGKDTRDSKAQKDDKESKKKDDKPKSESSTKKQKKD